MTKHNDIIHDLEDRLHDAEISREFWRAWHEAEQADERKADAVVAGIVIIAILLLGLMWWRVFA